MLARAVAAEDSLGGLRRLALEEAAEVVEVEQEFVRRLAVGQKARVEDETATGEAWTGRVARLAGWYAARRGTNEKPSWAPNGRYLLFSSTRGGKRQLYVMQPDGSNQRAVTSEHLGASDPAWGPLPPSK